MISGTSDLFSVCVRECILFKKYFTMFRFGVHIFTLYIFLGLKEIHAHCREFVLNSVHRKKQHHLKSHYIINILTLFLFCLFSVCGWWLQSSIPIFKRLSFFRTQGPPNLLDMTKTSAPFTYHPFTERKTGLWTISERAPFWGLLPLLGPNSGSPEPSQGHARDTAGRETGTPIK